MKNENEHVFNKKNGESIICVNVNVVLAVNKNATTTTVYSTERLPLTNTGHKLVIKPGAFFRSYLFSVEGWPHFYL